MQIFLYNFNLHFSPTVGKIVFFFLYLAILLPSLRGQTTTTLNGPTGSAFFGTKVTVLSNGNYVITDPNYTEGIITYVGAVYLYDGQTHMLLGILKGSKQGDNVGSDGVTALSNGNYVVHSSHWDNGAVLEAGAVTWCNGTTGTMSVVSSTNSLVGSKVSDNIGSRKVTALSNGNYVVCSQYWNNGNISDAGAVTWCNGTIGTVGVINSNNSLVGSNANDNVGWGLNCVTELPNGNYVVTCPSWNNQSGSVTWCSGTAGKTGVISSTNSLVGSADDNIGSGGVYILNNGNYIVRSPGYDLGTVDAGAVTWCDGATGRTGLVNSNNSFVETGSSGVVPLNNGNYVVVNTDSDVGISLGGSVTWCSGTIGRTGSVSISNSLVGSTAFDRIGYSGVVALSNGNYVVSSPFWAGTSATSQGKGAVTWCNGTTGTIGIVSNSNSLVGNSDDDNVGYGGIIALSNGNYVVSSPEWDSGVSTDVGAVTWCNGAIGTTGIVSSSNSLVGNTANDQIGSYGYSTGNLIALSNGNYVVLSPKWDNGSAIDAGAVTLCDGTTSTTGIVSGSNSLIGSTTNDNLGDNWGGEKRVIALTNGNYVVYSPYWDNGSAIDAGAVTWGNGTTGVIGVISSSNSLVSNTKYDKVGYAPYGYSVTALSNGNYVVRSPSWDNDSVYQRDFGAVTWGDGTNGTIGVVSSSNSLVGSQNWDQVGDGNSNSIIALSNGNYMVLSEKWNNGTTIEAGAVTWGDGNGGTIGTINTCNSILGTDAYYGNDFRYLYIYNNTYNYLLLGKPYQNQVVIFTPCATSIYQEHTVPVLNNFNIIPNPNEGDFELEVENSFNAVKGQIEIINLMGQSIYHSEIFLKEKGNTIKLSLNDVSNGVYFVRIAVNDIIVERKMLVIK